VSRGVCASCGSPVMWARTIPGKQMMPLDPKPYPDDDERATAARIPHHAGDYVRIVTAAEPLGPSERRYMPHFATCPARQARPLDEDPPDD
jgi:hypothetical protein